VLWHAGAEWIPDRSVFTHLGKDTIDDDVASDRVLQTDCVCGCVFLVPERAFRTVGLFDEDYFLTYEEADWCFRARKLGLKVLLASAAKVWHKVSASFGGGESPLLVYFMTRNRLLWMERHIGRSTAWAEAWRDMQGVLRPALQELRSIGGGDASYLRRLIWSVRSAHRRLRRKLDSPMTRARVVAIRDYLLRRFGDCPAGVRALPKARPLPPEAR
jgi:GT2 family glycosyltransferase